MVGRQSQTVLYHKPKALSLPKLFSCSGSLCVIRHNYGVAVFLPFSIYGHREILLDVVALWNGFCSTEWHCSLVVSARGASPNMGAPIGNFVHLSPSFSMFQPYWNSWGPLSNASWFYTIASAFVAIPAVDNTPLDIHMIVVSLINLKSNTISSEITSMTALAKAAPSLTIFNSIPQCIFCITLNSECSFFLFLK